MLKRKRSITGNSAKHNQRLGRKQELDQQAANIRLLDAQRHLERRPQLTEDEIVERRLAYAVSHAQIQLARIRHVSANGYYVGRCNSHPDIKEHNCGSMDRPCARCAALYFQGEKTSRDVQCKFVPHPEQRRVF